MFTHLFVDLVYNIWYIIDVETTERRMAMKQVMVKLEDELQKEARIEAIRQNKSLTQYVSDLVARELEKKKEQSR